ncbi:g-type lectin s-receptor-like serine/threonine-protein kinase [Quercus suber]|uniref:G-type lectin s-receptor-like serine/threonine-protein kinase n=1 Tax=Quercus suber TaxID=58331 RepID=A0AAW0JIL5_QUESU
MERLNVSLDIATYNVLLNRLFGARRIEEAVRVFDHMRGKNLVSSESFTILIHGLYCIKELRKAMKFHDEMLNMGLKPTQATYKHLISGGPWNSSNFIGIPEMSSVYYDGFSLIEHQDGTYYFNCSYVSNYFFHYVLTTEGDIEQRYWDYEKDDWGISWNAVKSECDVYGMCGAFGSCNSKSSPICSCLPGFEPKNTNEWNRRNWTSGCVRRTPSSQCAVVNSSIEAVKMDGFLKLKTMKVPDFADSSLAPENYCRQQCLENCSCIVYAYDSGTGCMSWTRSLIDILSSGGVDLYIHKVGDGKKVVTISAIIGAIFISICTFLLWRWMAKQQGNYIHT